MSNRFGLALLCDMNGNITQVLHNLPGLNTSNQIGVPFTRLVAPGSLAKALSFLVEIRTQSMVFDWEINIVNEGLIRTLHFTGGQIGDSLLIVGGENSTLAQRLYEEMLHMSNEQVNLLREVLKENSQRERDDRQYDEISRLNNELVAIQRELAKKNAELENLNKEKNRFLGMAAHDLRNPLYVILTASEFLLSPDPPTDDFSQTELLQAIQSSSEFMVHLVDDLLDVAKIEAGELKLDYSAVDLGTLLLRNAAFNRPLAARKQLEIDYKLEPLLSVAVDIPKLEQVLNNLLGNAIKFSEPGNRIEVRVERADQNFLIVVKDHGGGIAPEQLPRLFKAFQQGQKGTQGEKSTGLGLVIVKRIVEGHGGKIWVESEVGSGTTFYVSIPFQPPDAPVVNPG